MTTNRLPPEWAPQTAIQLTWPRPDGDFADWFEAVEDNFLRLAVAISRFQNLIIGTTGDPQSLRERLIGQGAQAGRLSVYPVRSNDVWARDHGPITVFRDGRLVHLDFQFNGWGGKFAAALDNTLTRQLAEQGALTAPVEPIDFVLEGGGIEVDSLGTLLTTRRCLLAPTRNPQYTEAQIEALLKDKLGVNRVLWLDHGDLIGDDTDGHIDTIARYCDAETIVYQGCDDRSDAHHNDLAAMADELRALRDWRGEPYRLVALPLPKAIFDPDDGRRLPAGYANFLILNGAVLVPVYGQPLDAVALDLIRPLFPDREVIGIDCNALIQQYGGLHCVTMQIPALA